MFIISLLYYLFIISSSADSDRGKQPNPNTMLFLIPVSAPRLVYQRLWYVLSCLWGDAYKIPLAVNRKE